MAEILKGLSIDLDLNTIKLDRGLKGVKDSIKTVNSEMKANMSAFDRGDKSVEKYETRLAGLNKKLEVQKTVVKEAKSEYEKMVAEYGAGSKQAEKAAREYNNQAAALNNLERYVQQTKNELTNLKKEQAIAASGWTKVGNGLKDFSNKMKGFGTQMVDVGSQLTKKLTLPAMGAASALGGITLVKGFDRLIGIDTAQAKLKGLGHDAEGVETIMESALDSVKGTSFGLGEAATTAANAVAAGVEPGKELTKYLSTTGDAAAIAGTSMGEMGSILNRVKTSNKAYNGELQQLSDRGLPVYQWLAEEAGVAAEEVTNLAAEGKISSEMLMSAIENNIGGAAQTMGQESFTAGIANMWAAVGRLGASFLDAGGKGGGFFSQLKPLIVDFTNNLDTMGDFAENAGVKFGEFFASVIEKGKALKATYDGLSPLMQEIVKKILLFGSVGAVAIGPLLLGLGKLVLFVSDVSEAFSKLFAFIGKNKALKSFGDTAEKSAKKGGLFRKLLGYLLTGLRFLTGPIGWVITGVLALGTAFVTAYKKSETFREGVNKIIDGVKNAFAKVKEFIEGIKGLFHDDGQSGRDILASLGFSDKFIETVDFIALKLSHLKRFVTNFIDGIKGLFKDDGQGGRDLLSSIGISDKMIAVLDGIALKLVIFKNNIKTVISEAINFVKNAWSGLTSWFSSAGGSLVEKATNIFGSIKTAVSTGIQTAVDFVKNLWGGLINWWSNNGDSILAKATSIFNSIRDNVSLAISAVVGYVMSVWSGLTEFWNQHGEMISQAASNVWGFIKTTILGTANIIWAGIKGFATGIYTAIKWALDNILAGWAVVWPYIRDIATGVINAISSAVQFVFPYIVTIIKGAMNVISNIMSYVWPVVKFIVIETWNAIKGTIDGALKVITGLIQFFSALFTGNWSALWDSVKQILGGAVQFIWNFVQVSFFGRIIKGGMLFIKGFAGLFRSMWTGISNLFSTVISWIVGFVRNSFTTMSNTVSSITSTISRIISTIWNGIRSFFGTIISGIVNFVKNSFSNMWNIIKNIFNGIRSFITSLWNNVFGFFKNVISNIVNFVRNRFTGMRDSTSNIFTGIRDTAQRLWNAVKEKIWNPVKNIVTNVKERFGNLKDSVSSIFSNLRDNVSDWIGKMVQAVKDMPGKMKDGLVQMAYKVKDGVKGLGQKMMDGIGGGVNGVIGGVNWVLGKLQVPKDKRLDKWTVPQLAHGTKSHKGGPALINDGKGDNAGPELIINPDGTAGMYEGKNVLANLAKGTQVIPAKMTRQLLDSGIPAYAKGIFGSAWDDIKFGVNWTSDKISTGYNYAKDTTIAAGKKIGEWTGNVWDYVENPGKLLNIALEKVGVSIPDGVGTMIEIAKGAFNTVKDKAIGFIKEKLNMGGPEGVSGGMGLVGAAGGWRSQILRAAAQMNETVTPAEVNGILAQIQRESGGNQRIIQSRAVWDVNWANNNPARGLLQYIPQTFNAYKVKGFGNIYDGYHQLLAFFNNKTWRRDLPYGKRGWGPRGGRKYKQGTNYVPEDGPAYLHKGEAIIPAQYNRPAGRTEAMKLLALAGKQIAKNNSPHQLPNPGVGGNSAGIEYLESMVSLLSQQVDDLKQIILLLTQLVAKNPNIQIGEHEFKTYISKLADEGLNDIGNKKKTAWGGA